MTFAGFQKRIASLASAGLALALLASMPASAADGDSVCDLTGSGTIGAPWQISAAADLKEIGLGDCAASYDVSQYYVLTQDIQLPSPWTPVENLYVNPGYLTSFDGNGKTISGLQVNATGYAGIFTDIRGAVIKDLTITGTSVVGTTEAGALAGFANESIVQNVKVQLSSVTGVDYTGGLFGRIAATSLANIHVEVSSVTGVGYVGGVVGKLESGTGKTIEKVIAKNTGVTGRTSIGGLFGGSDGYSSFNKLAATGATVTEGAGGNGRKIGGLIGFVSSAASVTKSLFKGDVVANTADTVTVGLMVGEVDGGVVQMTDTSAFGQVLYTTSNAAPAGNIGQVTSGLTYPTFTRSLVRGRATSPTDSSVAKYLQPFINQPNPSKYTITSSFWDSDFLTLTGLGEQGTSKTTAQLKLPATYTAASWPITEDVAAVRDATATEAWFINSQVNDGFPVLTWAYQAGLYSVPCPLGRFSADGAVPCEPAQPGFFVPVVGSIAQTPCPAGTTSAAMASECFAAQNTYTGPTIQASAETHSAGETIRLAGSKLNLITSISIDGFKTLFTLISDTEIELTIPTGVSVGTKDLVVQSSYGSLTAQGALRVAENQGVESKTSPVSWAKRLSDSKAKIYAKNIVGAGKVQFKLNGKEIAWTRAESLTDVEGASLRTVGASNYLVRTVDLVAGKNVLEIYADGYRMKRVVYSNK